MSSPVARLTAALADRYRVERELGAGGMATVHLARDLRHNRDVAIKVLRPELAALVGAERFLKEIEVTAKLQHPHILPLFDSGEADGFLFYVMPHVAGESLRARLEREKQLPVEEAMGIARAVASALDYAHRRGVVHRDIKPENILLQDDEAVVADFGIALAVHQAGGARLTETGLSVGTPAYMSPEQATGERELDARSDVYSLGCVLYEMLTGAPPHTGPTAQAVIGRMLSEVPHDVRTIRGTVSPNVAQAVHRALAKLPADRFGSAGEFGRALAGAAVGVDGTQRIAVRRTRERRTLAAVAVAAVLIAAAAGLLTRVGGGAGTIAIERIAVLPLDNLMGDTMTFFVEGMHDALIGELARLEGLAVLSRTSVKPYRFTDKTMAQIAAELDVDALLEGSVYSDGRTVRVQAQLIGVHPERHLWADSYDRQLGDALALHRDVARAVAGAVRLTLTPQDESRLATSTTAKPEALNDYLRGRYHFSQFGGPEHDSLALFYFGRALDRDSSFALAHAGLADALAARGWPRRESLEQARALALRALALDSTLAEAYTALGGVRFWLDWDWEGARRDFERAIRLNPSYAQAHQWHAELLATLGQLDSAVAEVRRAEELDPLSPVIVWNVGRILLFARRFAEAREQFGRALELRSDLIEARDGLLTIALYEGREADAYQELTALLRSVQAEPELLSAVEQAYAAGGMDRVNSVLLANADGEWSHRGIHGLMTAGRHDFSEVLELIEEAHRQRAFDKGIPDLVNDPRLDPLREHARFQAVLRAMRLPGG